MKVANIFSCAIFFALGCGGAAPAETAAPSVASPSTAAPDADEAHKSTTNTAPNVAPNDTARNIAIARSDLDRAEQNVAAAQSDCAAACRALASMERAAAHLCELDSGVECRRARERVDASRALVLSTCGRCGS